MGYETHFRLHNELDNKFVPRFNEFGHEDVEKHKQILIAICMLSAEGTNDNWGLCKLYEKILWSLKSYVNCISEEWKHNLKSRLEDTEYSEKNEVWFCGWENSERGNSRWTEEEIYDYFTKNLFMLAIHEVQPPFTNDDEINSLYHNKRQNVEEIVEEISDSVYDMWENLFIQRYRNSDDADESDGFTHKYPEEDNNEKN